ncbi:MAG: hypothetical protein K8U57_12025 [Planctomycetes bacterium]|nr:hypothetical protein [Planctomycetota bacterium]
MFQALVAGGRLPLFALALGLIASGGAALFLAATGHFLPHDERFLGMTAEQLCSHHGCRVVHFMIHDRAAFGGVVLAVGLLYLWLTEFPLRQRAAWAWWAILLSGVVGFASFLAYVVFGYLDAWHGAATLALLPCYVLGLTYSRGTLETPRGIRSLLVPSVWPPWGSYAGVGRLCLLAAAAGVLGAGATILTLGSTAVFVPEDLAFMGVSVAELRALNPQLVPLIAHDRAGFGGALLSAGVALTACVLCGRPSPALFQTLALVGAAGFTPAIGVHMAIRYTDAFHLAPAVLGAALYVAGLALTYRAMHPRRAGKSNE